MVKILDGSTFVLSDRSGDFEPTSAQPTGLFALDTRYLSTWVLTLDGVRLRPMSTDNRQYFQSLFYLVPSTFGVYQDAQLLVVRDRSVRDGFLERLTVLNHRDEPTDICLDIDIGADFADIPEIGRGLAKRGRYHAQVADDRLVLGYQREGYHRQTVITVDAPARLDEHGLHLAVTLPPSGAWTARIEVDCQ